MDTQKIGQQQNDYQKRSADINREGLQRHQLRVARMYQKFSGLGQAAEEYLIKILWNY